MPSLWKFGGLSPLSMVQLAITKIGEDELSTRSASLSYYFLLALFPMFLFGNGQIRHGFLRVGVEVGP